MTEAKQDFFKSDRAIKTGLWLGKHLPPGLGYGLADVVSWLSSRSRQSPTMQGLYQNLCVVMGPDAAPADVWRTARQALRHAGRSYFDLYHAFAQGKEAVRAAVSFTPAAEEHLRSLAASPQGAVIVGGHLSNFDLIALAFSIRSIPTKVLAWADPTSGYTAQNRIRASWGLDVSPISVSALRQALQYLRQGGMVVTGVDRPDPFGGGDRLTFFGRPAQLPTGHIRLALQAQAPVGVAIFWHDPAQPHNYIVDIAPPFALETMGNREQTIRHNAQRVLSILENAIRQRPEQWLMFYPLWETEECKPESNFARAV